MFHRHSQGCKQFQRKSKSEHRLGVRLAAFFLCLFMLTGFFPSLARAADAGEKLSSVVTFDSITLHYADSAGKPGEVIQNGALIKRETQLVLCYTYMITEAQCKRIQAGKNYYLDVSPHLVLPNLNGGSALTIDTSDGPVQFGKIYANGSEAWVTFDAKENSTNTVLSEYGELSDVNFYLTCNRVGNIPADATEEEKSNNLYAMKFENNTQLNFGYAENEPVTAKAQINKGSILTNKTITWTIDYTPWQNPTEGDGITLGTPFELRDTIDTNLHSFVDGSVTINDQPVTIYTSRNEVQGGKDVYVIVETPADGSTTLIFGGTKFNAVQATKENPATPLKITYQTSVNDVLLLPGGADDKRVTNTVDLFAGEDGGFKKLNINNSSTVTIVQSTWLTKTGTTTRNPGNGSTTEWEVKFYPNGFSFENSNNLTFHDQLPAGSTLVDGSVKVDGTIVTAATGTNNDFTISPITTVADNQPVIITYESHVPEYMYDNGTSLGSNIAWFTFRYGDQNYMTPQTKKDVGSGDGSGTPGTATLVKTSSKYNAATRTIDWTVKINPHQVYLKSGTFTDDLKIGNSCGRSEHASGLELVNGVNGINVSVDELPDYNNFVTLDYKDQQITVKVGEVGTKAITLTYTTKVCDPCIFANNTAQAAFKNTILTNDMIIGSQSTTKRKASADSTAEVSATVLTKKTPVYDYSSGTMKWTVEVDAAGLSMADVVLTDDLPTGLTYMEKSLGTVPEIQGASASVDGQTLTINLGNVTEKTTITFYTKVDPEALGFGGDALVEVKNTIHMKGEADGVKFAEVSHSVQQKFSNHGLVKSSTVNNPQELIQYEVLINPYHLLLPEKPSLVDTLDRRLQLDIDTLKFYEATVSGTTAASGQKPNYTKLGAVQPLKVIGFDPETNSFTVQLPISADSRGTYVLTYTADIIDYQADSYSNSVRFDGGSVLLGGNKDNSASVAGGGGGGGGAVAARKATITIMKTDSETNATLSGVSFMLYQWDSDNNKRGLPFAKGTTDAQGKLSFKVKPNAVYELVETESVPGYGSEFRWANLPGGVSETDSGLLITTGAAKSELMLNLTNKAHTTDIVFRLVNEYGIPMAGANVKIFTFDPTGQSDPIPAKETTVLPDGTVKFVGIRRGAKYYILRPDGGIMPIDVPAQINGEPKVILPDGTTATLNADYQATGIMTAEQQWELTVKKVISGDETPLAGATIGLYVDATCQNLIISDVSAQDGTITFSGLIKGQNYWLKEIAAPNGYQLNSRTYEGMEGTSNVTIENTLLPVNSGNPDNSGSSDNPSILDNPGNPDSPGTPDNPGNPDNSGNSDNPGNPDASGNADNPNNSYKPGSGVISVGSPNVPQTGDNTPFLIVGTLLSGIVLVVMTLYRFLEQKKREKK